MVVQGVQVGVEVVVKLLNHQQGAQELLVRETVVVMEILLLQLPTWLAAVEVVQVRLQQTQRTELLVMEELELLHQSLVLL
jgi:hypothetical protein